MLHYSFPHYVGHLEILEINYFLGEETVCPRHYAPNHLLPATILSSGSQSKKDKSDWAWSYPGLSLWFFWWGFYKLCGWSWILLAPEWVTLLRVYAGVGNSTNTKAELVGLWALLLTSQMMGIPLLHVFGDSSVIINWAKVSTALSPPELSHWCRETRKLFTCFLDLSFIHIYHEHNQIADHLSKTALSLSPGFGCFSEFFDDLLVTHDTFKLFWALCESLLPYFCSSVMFLERAPLDCWFDLVGPR